MSIFPGTCKLILMSCLVLSLIAMPALAGDADHPLLDGFVSQMDQLVDSPGASGSIAAGLVNPAIWPVLGDGGLFISSNYNIDEPDSISGSDISGIISFRTLALAINRQTLTIDGGEQYDHYDYTLGLAGGDRSRGFGISYSWTKGALAQFGSSERLTAGIISRRPLFSVGLSAMHDFDNAHSIFQGDIGLRPLGPRWTLFGGLSYLDADEMINPDTGINYDQFTVDFGIEAKLLPGLTVAARGRDTGEIGLRLDLTLGKHDKKNGTVSRGSFRYSTDSDQEGVTWGWASETTRGPTLSSLWAGGDEYPEINLNGPLAYRTHRYFDDRRAFLPLLQQIRGYAENPQVGGVLVNMSGIRVSPANLWELRSQLAGLRAEGKKVVVYFDRLNIYSYTLACVADEIWMDPWGDLDIKGLAFGTTYLKEMLDKVGIGFEEWRYFRYKAAAEVFARTSMSDGQREQLQVMMDSWFDDLVDLAVSSRGISRADWEELMNSKAELMPAEALAAGLVDKVGDFHEAREAMNDVELRQTGDTFASRLTGVMGDPVWGREVWGEPERIAVLYAIGECSMDTGIKGRQLSRVIRSMRDNADIKAVVMRADSPGGDPLPSDLVTRELKETMESKPVIISQGQVAASGGYWISMNSHSILASPLTITGSIGVISGHIYDNGIGEKVGMRYDGVQIGDHADLYNGPAFPLIGISIPARPSTEEERERGKSTMLALYDDFVGSVARGRGMTVDEVKEVAQGRIWSGTDGLEVGLVDEIGGLWEAIRLAKSEAGIAPGDPITLVEGPDLPAFDLGGMFSPRLFGIRFPWFGGEQSGPVESLLQGSPWESLPENERIFLEMVITSQHKPLLLADPISISGAVLDY
jgi:protease IV